MSDWDNIDKIKHKADSSIVSSRDTSISSSTQNVTIRHTNTDTLQTLQYVHRKTICGKEKHLSVAATKIPS